MENLSEAGTWLYCSYHVANAFVSVDVCRKYTRRAFSTKCFKTKSIQLLYSM